MKKLIIILFVFLTFLTSCGSETNDFQHTDTYIDIQKEKAICYPDTEIETFTSLTGIDLNITETYEESNTTVYNYLLDNDAAGVGSIIKYENYIKNIGFEKSEALSNEESSIYLSDAYDYLVITGTFYPQSNIIQYVVGFIFVN